MTNNRLALANSEVLSFFLKEIIKVELHMLSSKSLLYIINIILHQSQNSAKMIFFQMGEKVKLPSTSGQDDHVWSYGSNCRETSKIENNLTSHYEGMYRPK